ncbi:MAG: hypothetical protein QW548_00900 [Candidatus Aenigmatarchaeota archaeon]
MPEQKSLKLSPSSLNAFRACPRCFWMDVHGKGPPGGPFPSLPSGIDQILKAYYDKYRSRGLPPLLDGKIDARLVKASMADALRKRLSFTDEETGAVLWGMMDDCFTDEKGTLMVMDNKTRGFPLKNGMDEELLDIYTFQLECYALLLEKNGHKVSNFGYLVYYIPEKTDDITNGIKFSADVRKVLLNTKRVMPIFRSAVAVARRAAPPGQHEECELCHWVKEVAAME